MRGAESGDARRVRHVSAYGRRANEWESAKCRAERRHCLSPAPNHIGRNVTRNCVSFATYETTTTRNHHPHHKTMNSASQHSCQRLSPP